MIIGKRQPARLVQFVVCVGVLNACANVAPSEGAPYSAAETPDFDGSRPKPYWDDLLVGGLEVPNVGQAAILVSFEPTIPDTWTPDKVVVGGGDTPAKSTIVAMRFETDSYGMFWILEQESQTDQAELEALATTCDPTEGCEGSWTLTKLNDGTVALSISGGPEATSIVWLDGAVRFDVIGPSSSFTPQSAIAVANNVVSTA